MKPHALDVSRAKSNPWGLTPHECCTMRLLCKYGSPKQVWAETDIPLKTVHYHSARAAKKMGARGHDVRIFIEWDRMLRGAK